MNTRNGQHHQIETLLITHSNSTEILLRHAVMACGYKFKSYIDDISESKFKYKSCEPEIVFLDQEIFRGNRFIEILDDLETVCKNPRILVIGESASDLVKCYMLKAGIKGFLALPAELHLLSKAIKEIVSGNLWFERCILNSVLQGIKLNLNTVDAQNTQIHEKTLTRQERTIAEFIGHGMSNKEIATKLSISVNTVKLHLTRIFQKLGISNRVQLALLMRKRQSSTGLYNELRRFAI